MPVSSVDNFVSFLRQSQLLEPAQLDEVARTLQPLFPEPRALARELIKRGWLTAYQVNQLSQARGSELIIGQYVLLERLGAGGMGQVFKARHRSMGRTVALKIIRKDRLNNSDAIKRFQREIIAVSQLSHPNVVIAFDADAIGGLHFFAMEYVDGIDLARLVKESGPLPIAKACNYVYQAALGLQHAHERGMIHRDIKPANLLLTRKGEIIKILDMGLARLEQTGDEGDSSTLTQDGKVIGTPDYIAPEQARNSHTVDIRSDLYSLGCTFYYLLSGKVPFPGGSSVMERLMRHQIDDPVPIETVRPDVPLEIRAILGRLIVRRPEDRFQTPAELARALEPYLRGDLSAAPIVVPFVPVVSDETNTPTSPFADLTPQDGWPALDLPASSGSFRKAAGASKTRQPGPSLWQRFRSLPRNVQVAGAVSAAVLVIVLISVLVFSGGERAQNKAAGKLVDAENKILPPLDQLDSANIPEDKRFPQQPAELVAVLGDFQSRKPTANAPGLEITYLSFLADGTTLAMGAVESDQAGKSDGFMKLWDLAKGRSQRLPVVKDASVLGTSWAYDPNRKLLAAATREIKGSQQLPGVRMWNATTNKDEVTIGGRRFTPGTGITALAFSPDGKLLATATWESRDEPNAGVIKLWETNSWKEREPLKGHPGQISALAFSADGRQLAALTRGSTVKIWDLATIQEVVLPSIPGQTTGVTCLAFAPKGSTLATGSSIPAGNETITMWAADSGVAMQTFRGLRKPAQALAFAPDGRQLVATGQDRELYRWQISDGKLLQQWPLPAVADRVAFREDGRFLATANDNGTVFVFRLTGPNAAVREPSLLDRRASR